MKLIQTQVVDKVQQARRKEEARLLAAAEVSKQDVERFLMELEEQHSWVAYELNARNLSRLKQSAKLSRFKAHLARELREGIDKEEKESGLMSYKGLITSFTRWQNSPAKHLDLEGHGNAILSVKISKCRQYLLSCSTDMTAKVWELSSGINLRVYPRHERIVLDCDIHPSFVMDSPLPLLITCSGKFVYLWCTSHDFAIKKIAAHEEIVYKCSFSPSGAQIITCSEDHSLRLWAFPECFHLFTFEGHQAPVTTARFSPSGRFILSGSSYAERKLLLWDAAMPKIHNPLQFCCVIFWTTDGLIKRICLQRKVADWTFWLTKAEALRVKGLDMEALPGELDVVEMDTESERSDNSNDSDDEDDDESENIDPFEDAFFAQDIRTCQGARLVVLSFDGEEEGVKAATEYIPGSYLVIRLQSGYEPIIEASITVAIKSLKYDSFACASGSRAGVFLPLSLVSCMEGADEETRDEVTGLFSRGNAPAGYKTDSSGQAFTFRSMDFKESYGSLDEESRSNTIEILWACPNLFDLGPLVITVNLKLRGERRWQPLRYSLRESSTRKIRIVDDAQSVTGSQLQAEVSQDGNRYPFDQSAKHSLFWSYIREQQWQAVDALLDEKCILFYEKEDTLYRRRWRCSEFLRHSFGELKGLIFPTPLVYSPGSTRSSIVLEESEFRSASELVLTKHDPFNRRLSLASSTVFEASLSLKLGGTSTKVPQLQRKDLLPVMDSSRATALPKLSLDSPVHNNVAPPSPANLASHAVAVRISDVSLTDEKKGIIESSGVDLGKDVLQSYEIEALNRNIFIPTSDINVKASGFGVESNPDFTLPYPAYYPHHAGKAFSALRSRLHTLEASFLQQERGRVPSIDSVELPLSSSALHSTLRDLPPQLHTSSRENVDRNRRTLELVAADKESLKADETLAADDRVPSYDNHSKGIYIVNIENITQMQGNKGVPLDTKDTKNICFKRRERYYELPDLPPPKGTLANQRLLQGRTSDNKCKKEVTESSGLLRQFRSFKGMEVAHSGSIHDAIFSPSDFRVASAGGDKLIKLWDPATGVFIRSLLGHEREVLSLFFSQDNLFLISSSADGVILIWSMTDFSRSRSLRGHSDCVYSITAFPDISVIISASHDKTIKTWHLNPRRPDPPRATRAIGMTETSILLTWTSPPAFSEPITAFHLQYRVGLRNQRMPEPPLSLAPSYRTKNIDGLVSNTGYFFRIAAENSMGKSEFSEPSKQIMTVEGKPMAIGRPVVWEVTAHSISLFWFTPNPLLFGSAGRTFYLHTVLNGELDTEESCWKVVTLAEGGAAGRILMQQLVLRKEEEDDIEGGRKLLSAAEHQGSLKLSTTDFHQALERKDNDNFIFLSATVEELICGTAYRFFITSRNSLGDSPPSELSYTILTRPGVPHSPSCPFVSEVGLTFLRFQWDAPHDGGTAILGYRVLGVGHLVRDIVVKRTQTWVLLEDLQPNTVYPIQVVAFNACGNSLPSDCSTILSECRTSSCPPDSPPPFKVISGTRKSIFLEGRLPYPYGTEITAIILEKRIMRPFLEGEWEDSMELMVPNDVEILNSTSSSSSSSILERGGHDLEGYEEEDSIASPYGQLVMDDKERLMQGSSTSSVERRDLPTKQTLKVNDLQPDTVYQFRFAARNSMGDSGFSFPSQRAKTNSIRIPHAFDPPQVFRVRGVTATLQIVLPPQPEGSSPLTTLHVDTRDALKKTAPLIRSQLMIAFDDKYVIEPLRPGGSYQFRVRGESVQGKGPQSQWSETVVIPMEKVSRANK